MRIGFDITVLWVAQAGVFYYTYNLMRAMLDHHQENEYLLLDYYQIHRGRADPLEIGNLETQNARLVRCQGLRHRRLVNWRPMWRPALRCLAALVDQTLFRPWSVAASALMQHQLAGTLDGVDVFHSSDVLLWRQPNAVNVVTIYDLTGLLLPEYHTANNRELQLRKYRFAQEEADAVIAISEATKRDIVTHLKIPAHRVHVVYGGVSSDLRPITDLEILTQSLAPLGLASDGYILHVGTIEPRKNLVRLVEAYDQVRKMMPPPIPKLALVGATGWHFEEVFERIDALGLEEHVVFAGQVPTDMLPFLYSGAALFVYPSLYEGFGLPVLEAMACGVPVITSNVSSLPEIVGEAEVLIDPIDTQALATTLVSLLGDAERRQILSAAGLARAALFSWERTARDTVAVYEGAISMVHAD
jgi:glycosyltransferase involved in cell wall biosynthesis